MDDQSSIVNRAVVCSATDREIVGGVVAVLAAPSDVVQVQMHRGATPGYEASSVIASPHQPTNGRRHVLGGAFRRTSVEATQMLRVAFGELDVDGPDLDRHAAAVLPCTLAAVTRRGGDLVSRATLIAAGRPVEDGPTQRGHQRVIVEAFASGGVERDPSVAQQRQRRAGDFEPRRVAEGAGLGRIPGQVTRTSARDERLELPQRLASRLGDPGGLRLRADDARELAYRGVAELSAAERRASLRKDHQRFRDAQPLGGGVWAIPENALQVLEQRRESKMVMNGCATRGDQPSSLFFVQRGASSRERT